MATLNKQQVLTMYYLPKVHTEHAHRTLVSMGIYTFSIPRDRAEVYSKNVAKHAAVILGCRICARKSLARAKGLSNK